MPSIDREDPGNRKITGVSILKKNGYEKESNKHKRSVSTQSNSCSSLLNDFTGFDVVLDKGWGRLDESLTELLK